MLQKREALNRSEEKPFGLQRNHNYYISSKYLSPKRMSSYGLQYRLAINTNCSTFLNIGSANWILTTFLTQQGKYVVELDIDNATNPSVLGLLPYLPFEDSSFEVVMCFQVLEHLPFNLLANCMNELRRITSHYIIISLPDQTLTIYEKIKRFIYILIHNPKNLYLFNKKFIDQEHFWELGINGVSFDNIKKISEDLKINITSHFRNNLFDYHHFILLEKMNS